MSRSITDPGVSGVLQELAAKNDGILLPEEVVQAARPEHSILHKYFDWEDSEAADKWRLHQARNLIRVVVHYLPGREKEEPTKVFVSLSSDREESGYRRMIDVMDDKGHRAMLLSDAFEEMNLFRRKYGHLRELADVVEAMTRAQIKKAKEG